MRLVLIATCLTLVFAVTAAFNLLKTRDPLQLEAQIAMADGSIEPIDQLAHALKKDTAVLLTHDALSRRVAMLFGR
jgi:hypothetical protein